MIFLPARSLGIPASAFPKNEQRMEDDLFDQVLDEVQKSMTIPCLVWTVRYKGFGGSETPQQPGGIISVIPGFNGFEEPASQGA